MRILYVSDNHSDHNRRFVEAAKAAGHDAWFLDITAHRRLEDWRELQTVYLKQPLREVAPGKIQALLPEFLRVLDRINPGMVHAGPLPNCGYLAAISGFHPLVVTSWGSDLLVDVHRGQQWKDAVERALREADTFFCDCEAIRKVARQFVAIPDEKTVQFPWGVKHGSFSPFGPIPAQLHLDRESIPIICTRSWEPVHGIDVLLRAFATAYTHEPRLRLLLLGDCSKRATVRGFIKEHDLENVVLTPGRISRSEIPTWFRAAKIYVSCARCDGTSVSLLEAMATGLPVIVSDIPSNREWVTDGTNGWLAQVDSSEEFADRILKAASLNAAERERISSTNQQIVANRADWERNVVQLFQMYESLARQEAVVAI